MGSGPKRRPEEKQKLAFLLIMHEAIETVKPKFHSWAKYSVPDYGFGPETSLSRIQSDQVQLWKAEFQIGLKVVSQHFALKFDQLRIWFRARNAVKNEKQINLHLIVHDSLDTVKLKFLSRSNFTIPEYGFCPETRLSKIEFDHE